MTFAALQSRMNASVLRHLANAQAMLGGATIRGVFRNAYEAADVGVGYAGTQPTLTVDTGAVPRDPVGQEVVIDDVAYLIAAHQPGGSGLDLLILERSV